MLHAVCFDLMDTVITDPYLIALEAGVGRALGKAERGADPRAWPDFEVGLIDEAEFLRRFWPASETSPFDVDAFHLARRSGYAFVPGMDRLLDELAGRVKRYVASNYPEWVHEVADTFAFTRRFEGVFASCTLGVRKPDGRFYAQLLERIGHEPGHCLFVDDRAVNCEAAEAAGMRAHVFTNAEDLRQRLAREGVVEGARR